MSARSPELAEASDSAVPYLSIKCFLAQAHRILVAPSGIGCQFYQDPYCCTVRKGVNLKLKVVKSFMMNFPSGRKKRNDYQSPPPPINTGLFSHLLIFLRSVIKWTFTIKVFRHWEMFSVFIFWKK